MKRCSVTSPSIASSDIQILALTSSKSLTIQPQIDHQNGEAAVIAMALPQGEGGRSYSAGKVSVFMKHHVLP